MFFNSHSTVRESKICNEILGNYLKVLKSIQNTPRKTNRDIPTKHLQYVQRSCCSQYMSFMRNFSMSWKRKFWILFLIVWRYSKKKKIFHVYHSVIGLKFSDTTKCWPVYKKPKNPCVAWKMSANALHPIYKLSNRCLMTIKFDYNFSWTLFSFAKILKSFNWTIIISLNWIA